MRLDAFFQEARAVPPRRSPSDTSDKWDRKRDTRKNAVPLSRTERDSIRPGF